MKKIMLTKGKYALVDNEDFEWLNQWKWQLSSQGYAIRYAGGGRKNTRREWMHRAVNNTPYGFFTDHINGNKLDNRRQNLRSVSKSQNMLNSKTRSDNKSGYRGISWDKSRDKWAVEFSYNGKRYRLGRFDKLEEAISRYKEKSNELAKEYLYG